MLGFLDQGIVSASGLVTFVAAAQFLGANDLGYFSFGVATCLLVVSLTRAICGESLLVRAVELREGRPKMTRDSRAMLGVSIIIGLAGAALCAAAHLILQPESSPLLAAAIACPGLVLQDSLRFFFISLQRTASLLLNDTATLLGGASAIIVSGLLTGDVAVMIIAWGCASLLVGLCTLIANGIVPSFSNAWTWLRSAWRSSSAFFTESALGALVGYLIVVMLTVFVAPSEVAAYRATLVVYGVASLVINFLRTQVLRELRPTMLNNASGLLSVGLKLSIPVVVTILGMLGMLIILPEPFGRALMNETWTLIGALLIPGAVNRLSAGISTIPTIILRVQGVTWRATFIKIGVLVLSLALGPLGALYAGASGALYADAISYTIASTFLFVLAFRKTRSNVGRVVV